MTTIPLNHPTLALVRTLVPDAYHNRLWVGGSAATCWGENANVDVWIVDVDHAEWDALFTAIPDEGRFGPSDGQNIDEQYAGSTSAIIYAARGIHILLSALTIEEVVDKFDIACHAAAVNMTTGVSVHHERFIDRATSNTPVRILGWTNPRRTLARAIRFGVRYNDETFWDDAMTQTCAIVAMHIQIPAPHQLTRFYQWQQQFGISDGL